MKRPLRYRTMGAVREGRGNPSPYSIWPIQKLQTTRFDKMQKPNSVEHGGNGIGKLLVTFPVCEETKQNGSRIAVRSRL